MMSSLRPRASTRSAGRSAVAVLLAALAALLATAWVAWSDPADETHPFSAAGPPAPISQSREQAEARSQGCLSCHRGIEPIHASASVRLACSDCHGGNNDAAAPPGTGPGDAAYEEAKDRAHVQPRFPKRWARPDGRPSSANPVRSYTLLNAEDPAFVRFVNPGDLRVAPAACGSCHPRQVNATLKSPMTTSSIFWAAAAYANGILGTKRALLGESYDADGRALAIRPRTPPTPEERQRGALDGLLPLPRWEVVQPGEYFRAFERGGILQPSTFPELGNPNPLDEPGRPDIRLSNRGLGTGLRISPALINLHKTRLNDPHLSFLGTNDHPGDYRSSGCTACHLVYANDRDPLHSGAWAAFGHRGESASGDPTIPHDEPGHPVRHRLTRAVPTSQCMSCHMHQPNAFVNTYLGYTMWDYETDGEHLWPEEQRDPTPQERRASLAHNPEGAAVRGLWTDTDFLERVSELNPRLRHTQLADYHGHGWVFRAVFKRDRKGNLLDAEGRPVAFDDPQRFERAVHLRDIHLERGMHCVDCHFSQDVHGDGLIHGEYGNAIEIRCQDCHGSVTAYTELKTSGPAARDGGRNLALDTVPSGKRRFRWRGEALYQRSMLDPEREWEVPQVKDSVTPGHPRYSAASAWAKTVRRDGERWGSAGLADSHAADLAHSESRMTCDSCHSSWITSCSGCHLPQEANVKSQSLRYEGQTARNYASYNPQVIRTDAYMLGINGTVLGNKVAPVRSSSALVLSSTNANRQRIYIQQPPISAPGFSSQAFNPHVPHTVRTTEARRCSDCHLSENGDNNAWMAQLLLQGTGWVNFVGRFAWVGLGEEGLEAVAVTEWEEPQAVIGSYLQRLAYPDFFRRHESRGRHLTMAHHHHGGGARGPGPVDVRSLQLRGEYLYTAKGGGGFEVFDVANVDNKDFSERIVTAPVSPLGQRTYVATKDATAVALPTNNPVAPGREVDPVNQEQPLHPLYRYAYVSDRREGLILVDVTTLTDRDPANNFLERTVTFNPPAPDGGGLLDGVENLTVAGDHVYLVGRRGLAVVDVSEPLAPRLVAEVPGIRGPRAVAVQFRYAFVAGEEGLTVVDVTRPEEPRIAARLEGLGPTRSIYLARTYAYLAAGPRGVAIVDIERPEEPLLARIYDAEGELADVWDVKIGATNASLFAYVANGEHGLAVLQLTSPKTVPGYLGFSPEPEPQIIARYPTHGPAVVLSRGLDRDRAVDESGHQVAVFNRIGARPFTREEMERLYLRDGRVWTVSDEPPKEGPP